MFRPWRSALVLVAAVVMIVLGQAGDESERCTTPGGTPGRCVLVRECQHIRDFLRREQLFVNDTIYVERIRCGVRDDGLSLVCCPRLTNDAQCGPLPFATRIVGGNDTEIGEFPWLVMLRFEARNNKIHANCGGSLIGGRFVLTAAHCLHSAKRKGWVLESVRVAEWNSMNRLGRRDCRQLENFDTPICRKDYGVARYTVHPEYKVNYAVHINDIALIELTSDVEYSPFVAPICLPIDVNDFRPPNDTTIEYTAAGWGATSPGSGMTYRLKKINLMPFDGERCKKLFQMPNGNSVGEAHICAGGLHGQDTCHGDSGGPLMETVEGRCYLSGITSFGAPKCGKEGVPGVYTNVSHFLGWIEHEVFRGRLL